MFSDITGDRPDSVFPLRRDLKDWAEKQEYQLLKAIGRGDPVPVHVDGYLSRHMRTPSMPVIESLVQPRYPSISLKVSLCSVRDRQGEGLNRIP